MKLSNSGQMREMDRYSIGTLGMPSTLLMTNAAESVAKAAMAFTGDGGSAAVFCGAGNNGGDGIAAAVYLIRHGVNVRVFLTGRREKMTLDSLEMERRLNEAGGVLENFDANSAGNYTTDCGVVIDALFGIGLNSNLRGDALKAVKVINASRAPVVAVDIPSGVEADTGRVLGDAVRADVTVTFTLPKVGQYIEPGCTYCGEVRVADIGIPADLRDSAVACGYTVEGCDVSLPRRRPDTHKGDYGRDLIIAGSVGFTGAPVLAARAASRMGAGLVFIGVPETIYDITAVKCDEEMPFPLPGAESGTIGRGAAEIILERLSKCDACLIGPGLGRSQTAAETVWSVVKNSSIPLILDADGINAAAGNIDILDEASCPLVLTPHEGEFKRLGGDLLSEDRLGAAKKFASAHGCILVLKGHRTITALPDGSAYVNTTGGPAMAKGGSGDVLSGMITALVGQKFPIKDAVIAAVYLHGLAGDMCAGESGEYAVTAGDLIGMLPRASKKISAR